MGTLTESALRKSLLREAKSHLGEEEVGGDNKGPYVEKLFAGTGMGGAWCAIFQSRISEEAAPGLLKTSVSSLDLSAQFKRHGALSKITDGDNLKPGNLIFMDRSDSAAGAHSAMVVSFKNGVLTTIEGNIDPDNNGLDGVAYKTYSLEQIQHLTRRKGMGIGDVGELARARGLLRDVAKGEEKPGNDNGLFGKIFGDASNLLSTTPMTVASASIDELGSIPRPSGAKPSSREQNVKA